MQAGTEYRYTVQVLASDDQSEVLPTKAVTPPPTFASNVGVSIQMRSDDARQRTYNDFTFQVIYPLPRLGTRFKVFRVSDTGERVLSQLYDRPAPPPNALTSYYFVAYDVNDSRLDKDRSYTFEAVKPDGSRIGVVSPLCATIASAACGSSEPMATVRLPVPSAPRALANR